MPKIDVKSNNKSSCSSVCSSDRCSECPEFPHKQLIEDLITEYFTKITWMIPRVEVKSL